MASPGSPASPASPALPVISASPAPPVLPVIPASPASPAPGSPGSPVLPALKMKEEKKDSFCKRIRRKPPKFLALPEVFFRESMSESVVLVSGREEKKMKSFLCEDNYYVQWGSFVSGSNLASGNLLIFKHLHSNYIQVTVYTSVGDEKRVQDWSKAPSSASSSDADSDGDYSSSSSFDSFVERVEDTEIVTCKIPKGSITSRAEDLPLVKEDGLVGVNRIRTYVRRNKERALTVGMNKDHSFGNCGGDWGANKRQNLGELGKEPQPCARRLHFMREFRRCGVTGTGRAIAKAKSLQQALSGPSMTIVMTNRAIYQKAPVPFIVRFVDQFCSWTDGEIILKDVEGSSWKAQWKSGRTPKIVLGFDGFISAHGLLPGDVCVFEVISEGFVVHIFKAADETGGESPPRKQARWSPAENGEESGAHTTGSERKMIKIRENDVLTCSNGKDGMQVEIVFKKDSTGLLCPHLTALVPLTEDQFTKLRAPFPSAEAMLEAVLKTDAGSDS